MKHYNNFTVTNWLEYLENRHSQAIQLGLSRVKQVAKSLDLLKPKAKVITISGTNGKGSTVATLEAIYSAAGYQIASYTSPHLVNFNERIRVNQKPISDQALCHALSVIEEGRLATDLTYFEMATLAALWHFKQYHLDLIILEVGLGGRLDATNIINADLAIITTVDFDHQAFLGNTREAIGFEKAGIVRKNKPFIFADKNPPSSVVELGVALHSPMYLQGRDYHYILNDETIELYFRNQMIRLPKAKLHPNSVIAGIMASLLLQNALPLDSSCWERGIKNVCLSGRLELIEANVSTLLDVAHNPQAVERLADFIKKLPGIKKVHAVFSALKDKDIPGLIAPLRHCVHYWYPAVLTEKRAADKAQLSAAMNLYCKAPEWHNDPLLAYQTARSRANRGDLIVVYGSFSTVGRIIPVCYNDCSRLTSS